MKIFLDTSSLFKLYFRESDSHVIENILINNDIEAVFLSEISKIEFSSTVCKKVRTGELQEEDADLLQMVFESDADKYTFIKVTSSILQNANDLITQKYGISGLRTLDSIQLASVLTVKHQIDIAKTADTLLERFFQEEGINVDGSAS